MPATLLVDASPTGRRRLIHWFMPEDKFLRWVPLTGNRELEVGDHAVALELESADDCPDPDTFTTIRSRPEGEGVVINGIGYPPKFEASLNPILGLRFRSH